MTSKVNRPYFWDEIYNSGSVGWDLKSATPVFEKLLDEIEDANGKRILIPGSGYGYDAVAAAKKGLEVTAVDFSDEALQFARQLADKEEVNISFVEDDLFNLSNNFEAEFDFIYDYVTYCAVHPARRNEYIENLKAVIKPGGKLFALLFPVEEREDGPPFGVDPVELEEFAKPELKLISSYEPEETIKPRKGREILQVYKKVR